MAGKIIFKDFYNYQQRKIMKIIEILNQKSGLDEKDSRETAN